MMPRREFLVRSAAVSLMIGASVFVAVRVAIARNGVVGNARSFVTVAGTLTNTSSSSATITFEFQRRDGATSTALCAPVVTAQLGPAGAFSVPVPLDDAATPCPSDAFDGRDVWVRALLGGSEVAAWAPVNPVPYAHFATTAGTAAIADQYRTPACPLGYEQNTSATGFEPGSARRLCRKYRMEGTTRVIADEVVRVGSGASAFWIDRFEASVWGREEGGGSDPYFVSGHVPTSAEFNRNGQWTSPYWALSAPDVTPAYIVSALQAAELCRLSGKRLPTNEEWTVAARGTPDPTSGNDGSMNPLCNTVSSAHAPRRTNQGSGCVSYWGAQDMIGNLREYIAEWGLAPRIAFNIPTIGDINLGGSTEGARNWGGALTANDVAVGIVSTASLDGNGTTFSLGAPSVIMRGGDFGDGVGAGIFSLYTDHAPTAALGGFRCVIPR